MRPVVSLPPSVVRRAAAVARGPHACPNCERPTWAEPPVPWIELRDYVVRCDGCERPLSVRIDREAILRRGAATRQLAEEPGMYDAVAELLQRRGLRAFTRRVSVAAAPLLALAGIVLALGATATAAFVAVLVATLPAACFAPALLVGAWESVRMRTNRLVRGQHALAGRTVAVDLARWDQWHREEQLRARECEEQPEAVLEELARVLDERELRRVRALVEGGQVPQSHLGELARFRRSWRTVA